ncbi:hypothetical protein E2493_09365 [Sphingomonas parva]|uniref:Uncharacterized protein n=1 Tax=Sphingomonas parva TaxID=2555898 RepID=A0A4Y8ZRF1_9SPHN|nr:hypothetical protein [Sphingomonas parva]TFI58618.1 hypothetical protein E2493_09365 [Sphingomonas parva]
MDFRNRDFLELVKLTRVRFDVSIDEAHDLIFADAAMRRLVAWRVNHDPDCRRQALDDIRRHGPRARFVRDGDRLAFRKADGGR